MDIVRDQYNKNATRKLLLFLLLIFVCTGINFAGADFVNQLSLPLYLDCIGTMVAAIFGGYIPGIIVGLISSFFNGVLTDPKSMSYGMLNAFIAIFIAWAYDNEWLNKISKIFLSIIICGIIGGFVGALITISLYGIGGGEQTQKAVNYAVTYWPISPFISQIIVDTAFDIVDKALSLFIVLIIVRSVPKGMRHEFRIHVWKQAPLTNDAVKNLTIIKNRQHSLRAKIIFLFGIGASLIAIASVAISVYLYRESLADFARYAGLELNARALEIRSITFLINQISLFVGIFLLIVSVFLYLARYHVILPLNTMAYAASKFTEHDENSMREMADLFSAIKIETGDETENLYNVISVMTRENSEYLEAIQKKNVTILDMQNALIIVLADLVESRDNSTGNHIKNTAEYVELIMDEMLAEGVYTEQLTQKFISDVYQSAPLHDIGKISVSDVILNKPGKLTDEEFAIMKRHSLAGAEIIDRVIDTLPDSDGGYLLEARNLALYHHEKWDGSGYPFGISGEKIPLSARIMAVADVFDALVSKRSYKEPFPFEKAISIIEESAGTHFDPLIAKAFLNAKDRIRFIAEEKDLNNV